MQSFIVHVCVALHVAADGWLACLYAHVRCATSQLAIRYKCSYCHASLKPYDSSKIMRISWGYAAGLHHIKGLHSLQHLVLWNCLRLTEGGLTVLASLTSLTHLSLRGCQQLTDSALPHLAALSALRHLNLTACERMAGL